MHPTRIRTWREFIETFIRTGVFSLQPLPTNQAEREQEAETTPKDPPRDITRLNLE